MPESDNRPAPPGLSPPTPELAVRRFIAELGRYELETQLLVAEIRDKKERRKSERIDQWLLLAVVVVAVVALAKGQAEWPPYVTPTLIAGVLFRLIWVTRGRGGPPISP